ncbi:MAG: hypothetical protein ACM3NJ_00365 [Methanobacterium sp.]
MIAAALNYAGPMQAGDFGPIFVKQFSDFKVVKLNPYEEVKRSQLQLCQPETYASMLKQIEKAWDPTGNFLELCGSKGKLQRVVRQMFFFDTEKEFERVFLEGCEGIRDFPWAIQIMIMQAPVIGWEQKMEWIRKADLLILSDWAEEDSSGFMEKVKMIRPELPVFMQKLQEDWPQALKDNLESLFAGYLKKRQRIITALAENCPEQSISCEQASRMAALLRVDRYLFGSVCDEYGYSISHCAFGCF